MELLKMPSLVNSTNDERSIEGALLAGASVALLSACGGSGGGGGTSSSLATPAPTTTPTPTPTETLVTTELEAARFLAQAGFGGNQSERQALINSSLDQWLNTQLAMPQSMSRWAEASTLKVKDPAAYSLNSEQLDNLLWKPIASSPDVLRQRMTLALSEIFVVNNSGVDLPSFAKVQAMCGYMDLLEKNAFGNFRQLLEAVTLSVPMGRMLGTLNNQKEDPKTGRNPDENYAREVMQLFTIGLYELNADGSSKKNVAGQAKESYSVDDVSNLARVFTGWSTFLDWVNPVFDVEPYRQPMTHDAKKHSVLEKKFLGITIPAGTDGPASLKTALDTLFNHPNVGPFIGKQLIQRFVTSNPSPAYIGRVSAAFANNGQGIRGDFKAVLKAILLDTEARTVPSNASAGKVVEPMVRVGTLFRGLKFSSPDGQWRLTRANAFGQQPLNAPSVFNFFRPGYVPPNTTLANNNQLAPELQIVNEQSVLNQANTITSLLNDAGSYTRRNYFDASKTYKSDPASTGLTLDLSFELSMVNQPESLISHLNLLLVAGQLSASTQQFIVASINKLLVTDTDPAKQQTKQLNRVRAAILMVLMAPEAQLLK